MMSREDVVEDLLPLFLDLLSTFEALEEQGQVKYGNNLIMLKYQVKGFKEAV